jgi:hypothetical protein
MIRWTAAMLIGIAPIAAASAAAQSPTTDILQPGKLTPEKRTLRDDMLVLRDSLDLIAGIHARVIRAQASGMTGVSLSAGRQLPRACRAGAVGADRGTRLISSMHTNSPAGDQALNQYRAALDTLGTALRACERDGSTLMADAKPDFARIESISESAVQAIRIYEGVRLMLVRKLDIDLPVTGKMFRG